MRRTERRRVHFCDSDGFSNCCTFTNPQAKIYFVQNYECEFVPSYDQDKGATPNATICLVHHCAMNKEINTCLIQTLAMNLA